MRPTAGRLLLRRHAALELRGEFFHATRGVDETLFAGVSRVRIHRHVTDDDRIFFTVDLLFTGRLHGGFGEKTTTGSDIQEADVV